MKKIIIISMLFIVGIYFSGCSIDSDPQPVYWKDFVTLIKDDSQIGYYFDRDFGGTIIPTNVVSGISDFDDSVRIDIIYELDSTYGTEEDPIFAANIKSAERILTKDIIQLTEENIDSIGNDFIVFKDNSIWFSDNHINIIFGYKGYNQLHYINLTKPIGEQTDSAGNQILEFRHNMVDDAPSYNYNSVVSFSVDSLYEAGMDSISFVIRAIEGDTFNFEYFDTFYFNRPNTESSVKIDEIDFRKLIE